MVTQIKPLTAGQLQPIFNSKIRQLNQLIQKGLVSEFDSTDWTNVSKRNGEDRDEAQALGRCPT